VIHIAEKESLINEQEQILDGLTLHQGEYGVMDNNDRLASLTSTKQRYLTSARITRMSLALSLSLSLSLPPSHSLTLVFG